jgi:hypothetical protein
MWRSTVFCRCVRRLLAGTCVARVGCRWWSCSGPPSSIPTSGACRVGWAAQRGPAFISRELGPFPGSLPPNPACPLSGHRAFQRFMRTPSTTSAVCIPLTSWFLYRSSPVPLRPVVRLSRSPDWADVTPPTTYGHSVAIGLASLRRSHVHTAIRQHDLGVPSVSLNALTGHRSCAPEDCSAPLAIAPQGPAPVSGIFPAGVKLHLLETGIQVIRLSPYRADLPARRPGRLGTTAGFLPCYFPLLSFRIPVRHQIQR